jgi:hypothetical protein
MSRPRQAWKLLPLVLALPALGGASICGVGLLDITQRELILEPVDSIDFEVDSGSIEVFTLDRNGVSLFYYMVGSTYDLGEVGHKIDGDTLDVITECEHSDFCNVDWYAEVAQSTAVSLRTSNGSVKLTAIDAPISADVTGGGVDAIDLTAPTVDVTVDEGDVTLGFLAPPTEVRVAVAAGAVAVTLPPGTYRCELDTADGELDTTGVTCDDTSTNLVQIDVEAGDITLLPGVMP